MMDKASVHLRDVLNALQNSQLLSNSEKSVAPDVSTAVSMFTRSVPSNLTPNCFNFNPFPVPDPTALLAFSQLYHTNFQSTPIVPPPFLSVTTTTTNTTSNSIITGSGIGPPSVKRVNLEKQQMLLNSSSNSSSSGSLVTSSCSPQQSIHRKQAAPVPEDKKDEAYYERRRKNNDAAKRSRDARRQKEEAVAARAAFLEQENIQLRSQVVLLKNETAKLQLMLFSKPELLDPKLLSSCSILNCNSSEQQQQSELDSSRGET